MKERIRVSVVSIFLNAERFIREAIDSVLCQTYRNWELLLVDDGSSDGSTSIARGYARHFPDRIRYLEHDRHQNLGKSASRNAGVRMARGEYLCWLDADDAFLPDKLERQVEILDRHPTAAMTYGPTLYWYGWTGRLDDIRRDTMSELGVAPNRIIAPPHLMLLYLKNGACVPCTCAWMVRKAAVESSGGSEDDFRNLYEDQVFLAKIVLNHPVYVHSDSWDKYRQHPDMSSNRAVQSGEYSLSRPHSSQEIYYRWLLKYASGISDPQLQIALKRAILPHDHPLLWAIVQKGRAVSRRIRAISARAGR